MHITPNNKLSNHYRKKKTRRTVWLEDQTVSGSFRQNIEIMREKTKTGMFYEDYLNPNVSFSNNLYPDFYSACPSMPSNDFADPMINPYANNSINGLKDFVGGDIEGLGENNSGGVFVLEHYENGNSTINSMVDVKDANDTGFDYTFEFVNCNNLRDSESLPDGYEVFYGLNPSIGTGPDGTGDFDGDGLSNPDEYGYSMGSGYSGLNANSWDSNENMPLPFQSSICSS